MGGRGSSSSGKGGSGAIKGLEVTVNGETSTYYFSSSGGTNYYSRGISGVPEPTPGNITAKEFKERVESNGAITHVIGKKEYSKREKEYKKDREETNKFLNVQWIKAAPKKRHGWKGH